MKKRAIAFLLALMMLVTLLPVAAIAEDDAVTVVSVSVGDMTFIEGEQNGTRYDYLGWDDEKEEGIYTEEYEYYFAMPDMITVELSDGSTFEGSPWAFAGSYGGHFDVEDDQSFDNRWGVGTHKSTFVYINDDWEEVARTEFNVIVIESPVESISVPDIELIENYSGYYDEVDGEKYFVYDVDTDEDITVTFKNGDVFVGSTGEFYEAYENQICFYTDQSYENRWGLGEHTAHVKVMGKSADVKVTVVESPVKSISVPDIEIFENGSGYYDYGYNDYYEQDENLKYFVYSIYTDEDITVEFKDGSVFVGSSWEFYEEYGEYVYISSDQTYETRWGLGEHTAQASVMGVSSDVKVTIVESPVKSISVSAAEIYEGESMVTGTSVIWNEDTWDFDEVEYEYYAYYVPAQVTVELKNGASTTCSPYELYALFGCDYEIYDHQSYENQWTVGTYTAYFSFMGFETEFDVVIKESPVKSIEVDDVTFTENCGGFDAEDGYYYLFDEVPVTVNYKDGTSKTFASPAEAEEATGHSVYIENKDSAIDNFLEVGEYEYVVEFCGAKTEIKVSVIEKTTEYEFSELPTGVTGITVTDEADLGENLTAIADEFVEYCKNNKMNNGEILLFDCVRNENGEQWYHSWIIVIDGDFIDAQDGGYCGNIDTALSIINNRTYYKNVWICGAYTAEHTLTFNMNGRGTQVAAQTIDDGEAAEKPADPTAEGFVFGGWYKDAACTEAFDFASPVNADTTVYAKWTPAVLENPFVDVIEGTPYYDAILWAYNHTPKQITAGTDATHFSPAANCTRGQVVTFLWRAEGCPEPEGTCPFVDVSSSSPYYKAIIWAAEQGITNGMDATHFAPNATVTRAQFVTFLWRYEGKPAAEGTIDNFKDAGSIAKPYQEAVAWAVGEEIAGGYNDGTFRPNATCTRWAVVLFMYRDLA